MTLSFEISLALQIHMTYDALSHYHQQARLGAPAGYPNQSLDAPMGNFGMRMFWQTHKNPGLPTINPPMMAPPPLMPEQRFLMRTQKLGAYPNMMRRDMPYRPNRPTVPQGRLWRQNMRRQFSNWRM